MERSPNSSEGGETPHCPEGPETGSGVQKLVEAVRGFCRKILDAVSSKRSYTDARTGRTIPREAAEEYIRKSNVGRRS